jgi:hypothetical protein
MTVHDRIPDGSGGNGPTDASVRLDWTDYGEPSSGIVEAVSRATDERATALPPLHDAVETDALNVLLSDEQRSTDAAFSIAFSYAGHRITAAADGEVVVRSDAP